MSYASVWRLAIRYLIVPVTLGEITKIGCSNLTVILCTTARLCFNIFHCALARSAASFCHHMIKSTHSVPCDFKLEKKITSSRASQTGHRKCKPGIMQRLCTGLCLCVCVSMSSWCHSGMESSTGMGMRCQGARPLSHGFVFTQETLTACFPLDI